MKKVLVLLAVGAIAGCVLAQVYSQNVVGYTKIELPAALELVSTSFLGENTIQDIFGALPVGSAAYIWNPVDQVWVDGSRTRAGWGNFGTNVVNRGSGLFIRSASAYNLIISGEAPLDEDSPVYTVAEGLTLLSFPYPAEVAFGDTALATAAPTGDVIYYWDNGTWKNYSKTRAGWSTEARELKLGIGKALFYSSSVTAQRDEDRPYDPADWE